MTRGIHDYEKLHFTIKEPSINELRNWKTKGKLLTIFDY